MYYSQFSFRQYYSTLYTLLNLIEAIIKAFDDGNFACSNFDDLQMVFDTVDCSILLG